MADCDPYTRMQEYNWLVLEFNFGGNPVFEFTAGFKNSRIFPLIDDKCLKNLCLDVL